MNWLFFALLPPALWAADNYITKHVLDRYFERSHPGVVVLFMAIGGLVISTSIWPFVPGLAVIESADLYGLLLSGAVFTWAIIPSSMALHIENATYIAALFRTGPIFTYILALIFLGENLTFFQIIGCVLILVGAVVISSNLQNGSIKLKNIRKKPLFLMLLSTFLLSVNALLFKYVSKNELPFWQNILWQHIGIFLGGLIVFLISKNYRGEFIALVKKFPAQLSGWTALSNAVGMGGRISYYYATLFAPLAIVSTLTSFQPVFTLIYGLLLGKFIKSYRDKRQAKSAIIQEVLSILIILVGVFALFS